jgi:hypothetical protein
VRLVVQQRGFDEVARKTRTTVNGVRHWVDLRRRPNADARVKLQEVYDIPLASWEIPVKTAAAPNPPSSDPELLKDLPSDISAKELARQQVDRILRRLHKAEAGDCGQKEMAAIESSYTGAVRLYSKLSGEFEITESMVLRSSAWARIMKRLEAVLARHPEIAKEITLALADPG